MAATSITMPAEHPDDCKRLGEKYEEGLKKNDLTHDKLSFTAILYSLVSIMFGIVATLSVTNISATVAACEVKWIVLLLFVFTSFLYRAIELVVTSHLFRDILEESETWFALLTDVTQGLRNLAMFLVTTFATTVWIQMWVASHMNAVETMCNIWVLFLVLYFVLLMARS
jgi:hypothetical protein